MNIEIPRFAWRILAIIVAALLTAGAVIVATISSEPKPTQQELVEVSKIGACQTEQGVGPC